MKPRDGEQPWTKSAKAYLKRSLRRGKAAFLPDRSARAYRKQLAREKLVRRQRYTQRPYTGLFSVLTPVWDGSPPRYLRALANSIAVQNAQGACQWVLLDNGCRNKTLCALLAELSAQPWIKLVRSNENLGIIRGLRRCLEEASGRYVLPVDADDLLDDDALAVLASATAETGYPPLLYTDEDKIAGRRRYDPYRKPAWDPVLLLNSAYVAHLGVIDRTIALELDAYSDPAVEGSPDWDLFVRFLLAGYRAVHVGEIVYSWRAHPLSTAADSANKSYIASSQKAVLQRYLDLVPGGHRFALCPSPLWQGGDHWHFVRKKESRRPRVTVPARSIDRTSIREAAAAMAECGGMVLFVDDDLQGRDEDWSWEAQGILELHPETALVGGRIWSPQGRLLEAGLSFGADGKLSNEHHGRSAGDWGYFGQLWKERTVDAVSTQLAVVDGSFLLESLAQLPAEASAVGFGFWLSAYARRTGRRIVYSPFLAGIAEMDFASLLPADERVALSRYVAESESTTEVHRRR